MVEQAQEQPTLMPLFLARFQEMRSRINKVLARNLDGLGQVYGIDAVGKRPYTAYQLRLSAEAIRLP